MFGFVKRTFSRGQRVVVGPYDGFDFVAVGFPKTGNTWIRFMLGRYFQLEHGLEALPLFDPVEMRALRDEGYRGPTGTFTHEPLSWETQTAEDLDPGNVVAPFRDKRVIFLVRHPLDTMVSHYMHMKHRVRPPFTGRLSDFMCDPVFGLDKLFRFYQIWAECHPQVREFHMVRYEDMKREPREEFAKILRFMALAPAEKHVEAAVQFASFENLKALESSGTPIIYRSSGFGVFGSEADDRSNPNGYHVRKGEIGGYREEFPADECAHYEAQVMRCMPKLFRYDEATLQGTP